MNSPEFVRYIADLCHMSFSEAAQVVRRYLETRERLQVAQRT